MVWVSLKGDGKTENPTQWLSMRDGLSGSDIWWEPYGLILGRPYPAKPWAMGIRKTQEWCKG
jgi:hypothetical protein